jgi:signal transduction histidine kinase
VLTRLDAHGSLLRIAVIDHGAGIPESFRERVFERFAQADSADSRKIGGTGLGLSICRTIVEEHGGRIWFDSVEGEGTSFFVELPLAANMALK